MNKYLKKNDFFKPKSKTIKEFLEFTETLTSRYVPEKKGYIWKTSDKKITDIVNENFQDLLENFSIEDFKKYPENNNETLIPPTINLIEEPLNHNEFNFHTGTLFCGGYPAIWAAFLHSTLLKQLKKEHLEKCLYILPPNFKISATHGSSLQYHTSHAFPMYTDSNFSVFTILIQTFKHIFLCINSARPKYKIADIYLPSFFSSEVLKVGFGYFWNEIKYKILNFLNLKNIMDETLLLAVRSGKIIDSMEKLYKEKLLYKKNTVRIAYDLKETKKNIICQKFLNKYDVKMREITEDLFEKIGTIPNMAKGGTVWETKGDGFMKANSINLICKLIKKNGGKVVCGFVSDIIYDKNKDRITSVVIKEKKDYYLKID